MIKPIPFPIQIPQNASTQAANNRQRRVNTAGEILPKLAPQGYVPESGTLTLTQAHALLQQRTVRGIQFRYRYQDADWWDTVMIVGDQYRLIRIRTTSAVDRRISEWERIPKRTHRWTLGEGSGWPGWNAALYGVRWQAQRDTALPIRAPSHRDFHSHCHANFQSGVAGKSPSRRTL